MTLPWKFGNERISTQMRLACLQRGNHYNKTLWIWPHGCISAVKELSHRSSETLSFFPRGLLLTNNLHIPVQFSICPSSIYCNTVTNTDVSGNETTSIFNNYVTSFRPWRLSRQTGERQGLSYRLPSTASLDTKQSNLSPSRDSHSI